MKIKSGAKVRVTHKRKGIFVGYAAEEAADTWNDEGDKDENQRNNTRINNF